MKLENLVVNRCPVTGRFISAEANVTSVTSPIGPCTPSENLLLSVGDVDLVSTSIPCHDCRLEGSNA